MEESQVWDLNGCGLVGVKKRADLGGQGRKQRWRAGPQVWLSFGFFLRKLGVCSDNLHPQGECFGPVPQNHVYSSLVSPSQAGRVTLGAGTSTACAGTAPKPTSGPQSPCQLCGHCRDSMWAAGPATPWPSASGQPSLPWASTPGSLILSQMPPRKPDLKKPRTKRETGKTDMQKLLPKANLTGSEMGGL